jgi:hypothetical protein
VLILGAVVLLVLGLTNGSSGLLVGSIGTSLLAAVALVVGVRQATAARAAAGLLDDEDEQFADDEDDEFAVPERSAVAGRVSVPVRAGERSGRANDPGWSDEPSWSQEPGWSDEPARSAGRPAGPPDTGALDEPDDYRSGDFRRVETDSEDEDGYANAYQPGSQNGMAVPAQQSGGRDDYDDDEDPPDEPVAQRVSAADAARVARMAAEVVVIDGRPRYHVTGCVHLLGRPFEPLPVSEAVELGFSPCGLCEPDSSLLADARRV